MNEARVKADDLTPKERVAGLDVVKSLISFYKKTDEEIANSNILTRICVWIREFSFFPFTTRFNLEETGECYFRCYSDEKLIEQFGKIIDTLGLQKVSDGLFQGTLVKENMIRSLV